MGSSAHESSQRKGEAQFEKMIPDNYQQSEEFKMITLQKPEETKGQSRFKVELPKEKIDRELFRNIGWECLKRCVEYKQEQFTNGE